MLIIVDFILWGENFLWGEGHQTKYYWKINMIHNFVCLAHSEENTFIDQIACCQLE